MIIGAILSAIIYLVNLILLPIDALITFFLPDVNVLLDNFSVLLQLMFRYVGWAISASGIPLAILTLIVTYYVFVLTIPFMIYMFKLILRWYNFLKP